MCSRRSASVAEVGRRGRVYGDRAKANSIVRKTYMNTCTCLYQTRFSSRFGSALKNAHLRRTQPCRFGGEKPFGFVWSSYVHSTLQLETLVNTWRTGECAIGQWGMDGWWNIAWTSRYRWRIRQKWHWDGSGDESDARKEGAMKMHMRPVVVHTNEGEAAPTNAYHQQQTDGTDRLENTERGRETSHIKLTGQETNGSG